MKFHLLVHPESPGCWTQSTALWWYMCFLSSRIF